MRRKGEEEVNFLPYLEDKASGETCSVNSKSERMSARAQTGTVKYETAFFECQDRCQAKANIALWLHSLKICSVLFALMHRINSESNIPHLSDV